MIFVGVHLLQQHGFEAQLGRQSGPDVNSSPGFPVVEFDDLEI